MVEEMLKGENLREFYWTLRVGSRAYIALRYVNSNGRYLALVEYGKGGWWGFIVVPEGWEDRGWSKLVVKMRMVVAFLELNVDNWSGFGLPKVVWWF